MSFLTTLWVLTFLFDAVVDWMNVRSFPASVPSDFEGSFDVEKLQNSKHYLSDNLKAEYLRRASILVITVGALWFGFFESYDQWIRSLGWEGVAHGVGYFAGLVLLSRLIQLPFQLYDTFGVEAKYGFNRMNLSTFFGDQIKGLVLLALLGLPVLALMLQFFQSYGDQAWWLAWLVLFFFQLFITFVAPVWIFPLFNKFVPLEAGPLKDQIEAFAKKEHFYLAGLFKMDGSKRSTKSNAYFTGFGKTRRIVLFDTLIEKLSADELTAVLAHEIGHYKLGHIFRMLAFSSIGSFVLFFLLGKVLSVSGLESWIGVVTPSVAVSLLVASYCFSPISRIVGLFSSYLSRKHEFEADHFAATRYGKPSALAEALKKLSTDHLAHLTPHPLKVALEYSHPPVLARIGALQRVALNTEKT